MLVGVRVCVLSLTACERHRGNCSIELLRIKVMPELFPFKLQLKNESYAT